MKSLIDLGMEEREILQIFIETYENQPELWNTKNPMYSNKIMRNLGLQKLLDVYIQIKPGADITDVKRKINTLRTNYRKELKKILTSERSAASRDEVYKPTSWVFYALQFLDDECEHPVKRQLDQPPLSYAGSKP